MASIATSAFVLMAYCNIPVLWSNILLTHRFLDVWTCSFNMFSKSSHNKVTIKCGRVKGRTASILVWFCSLGKKKQKTVGNMRNKKIEKKKILSIFCINAGNPANAAEQRWCKVNAGKLDQEHVKGGQYCTGSILVPTYLLYLMILVSVQLSILYL